MAASDIVQRVRQHVYGNGFGESPSIIQGASDASETITNPTIAFDVATNEGAKLAAGDILSTYASTSQATAFELYVLSVSTDTVTAINGYNGSDQSAADELDGMLFELNPFKSEYLIWSKIETVFDNMLWPYVWKYNTQSVTTPDQSSYQNEVPAAIFQIEGAWQQYGPEWVPIAWELQRNLHTSVSSTGSLATLNVFDSSTVYLSTREKYLSSDTLPDSVQEVVAFMKDFAAKNG